MCYWQDVTDSDGNPQLIIDALAPHLGDERRARIDGVAASRLAGLCVVLEDLHDPHNGGAALRSCEAVGVLEMRIVGARFGFSERVTQGCEKWLNLVHDQSIESCVSALKARGVKIYAAVPGAKTALEELDAAAPAAFVIGNEHAGLSARARQACDVEFAIAMHGFSQSVNLSVATALSVYTHAQRRRAALGRAGDLDERQLLALRADYYMRDLRGADQIVERWRRDRGL